MTDIMAGFLLGVTITIMMITSSKVCCVILIPMISTNGSSPKAGQVGNTQICSEKSD
jgi:hypothetical protein